MAWKVEVNSARCVSGGVCTAMAPAVFEAGDLAATVRTPEVAPDDLYVEIANGCPGMAITVTDGDTEIAP